MNFSQYRQFDALSLAKLIRQGETNPAELLEIAIARLDAVNPRINAVVEPLYAFGRSAAKENQTSRPFAGVPFLIKDLSLELAGTHLRSGSRGYKDYVSFDDSEAVRRIKKAGLVVFGKTNTPEFGLTPFTEPKLFGPSRNPWNTEFTTGGSSGGSAAAVAAGVVPMATASDGGGSIRIPASCCGLFGLKPSRGRIPLGPRYGEGWGGAIVEGCVSRSVRDSAAYLDAMQGAMQGDPYVIEKPSRPYAQEVGADPGRLRVGVSCDHVLGMPIDDACRDAIDHAVNILRLLGHEVETCSLPYQKEDLTKAFLTVVAAETAAEINVLSSFLGRKVRPSDVEPNTFALQLLGKGFSSVEYAEAKRRWNDLTRRTAVFHEKYDLLLTPTVATRPFKVGSLQSTPSEKRLVDLVNTLGMSAAVRSQVDPLAEKIFGWIPWTAFANMTGQPSMSVPLFRTPEENLPVGVMFTAPFGAEDLLIRLASQLEKAAPWFDAVPEG